ncbi:MAG: 50S ribosomal protein L35 [Candidatus Paceibacterota bacterium]
MSKKTNKSFTKRLKVTKNGKIKSRRAGGNHFNAKESGEKKHKRGRTQDFVLKPKDRSRHMPHRG